MSEQNQPDDPIASCLDAPDVTPLERETIPRLRTATGWWKGDPNALKVLREFARKVVEEHGPSLRRFEDVLRKHDLVEDAALDDPEGFDNYRTQGAVRAALRELLSRTTQN